jgi:transcriptional regulator with XRE-family HTH domain
VDSATALRRQLLAELRRLRPAHIATQRRIADALDWSPSKVTRIESGAVSISVTDLRALLALYAVDDPAVVERLVDLARRSRRVRSAFAAFADVLPPEALRFFDHERSAVEIGEVALLAVPGLLQTPAYTRALLGVYGFEERKVERLVASRAARQELLDRPDPPTTTFFVDEAVLRRAVGGPDVHRAQLDHLRALAARPCVDLRVLPLAAGEHVGLRGPFVLLGFAGPHDPDVVYLEQRRGDALFRDETDVTAGYRRLLAQLDRCAAPAVRLDDYLDG